MKRIIVLLLLLNTAYFCFALTQDEETGLEALLTNFPALASMEPSWSTNVSEACRDRPFYGLTCSDGPDQHVLKMYAAVFFLSFPIFVPSCFLTHVPTASLINADYCAVLVSDIVNGTVYRLTDLFLTQ